MRQELEGHRRMRACLAGIRHLDPVGVDRRIAEFDREIERVEALLGSGSADRPAVAVEIVPIGNRVVRAA